MRRLSLLLAGLVLFGRCNAPPLYEEKARRCLGRHETQDVVDRLTGRLPLARTEAKRLFTYRCAAVRHLLAANPSTPEPLLRRIVDDRRLAARTGLAVNPCAPLDLLLPLRSPRTYTTENTALAMNPALSPQLLREMFESKEAIWTSFALNPSTPADILERIAREGSEIDRAWLATNPRLPGHLREVLRKDTATVVQSYLASGPRQEVRCEPQRHHED